jgi:hypothetical protein
MPDGKVSIEFLDANGKVQRSLAATGAATGQWHEALHCPTKRPPGGRPFRFVQP